MNKLLHNGKEYLLIRKRYSDKLGEYCAIVCDGVIGAIVPLDAIVAIGLMMRRDKPFEEIRNA